MASIGIKDLWKKFGMGSLIVHIKNRTPHLNLYVIADNLQEHYCQSHQLIILTKLKLFDITEQAKIVIFVVCNEVENDILAGCQ